MREKLKISGITGVIVAVIVVLTFMFNYFITPQLGKVSAIELRTDDLEKKDVSQDVYIGTIRDTIMEIKEAQKETNAKLDKILARGK